MEFKTLSLEDVKGYAKGSTKAQGKTTLEGGIYKVVGLELRNASISGEDRTWVEVHLENVDPKGKSGSMSLGRMISAGFKKEPALGNVSNKWYFPTEPIECVYEGNADGFAVALQGKVIEIARKTGQVPNFTLSSWDKKEDIDAMLKKMETDKKAPFSAKYFYSVKSMIDYPQWLASKTKK